MARESFGHVGEHPAAQELVGAPLGRVAVGARVIALADPPVERHLASGQRGSRLGARDVHLHRHSVRRHLDQHREIDVVLALGQERPAGPLGAVDGEEVLDAHHAAVRRDELRIARGRAVHRARGAAVVTVGAGATVRPGCVPELLGVLGVHHGRVVGRIEVVSEPGGPAPRERIALGILLGRGRPLERLQIRHQMDDLLRRERSRRAPRRHRRVGERDARIPDLLIEIGLRQPTLADRRQIRADVSRGPHVGAGHEVTAGARGLGARQEQDAALLRVTGHTRRWCRLRHRHVGPCVLVGVGAEATEVLRRPALVTHGLSATVGQHAHVAARLRNRVGRPARQRRVVGAVGDRGAPGEDQSEDDEPAHRLKRT